MAFFKNLVAIFFGAVLCVCSMDAVGSTEAERLNRADVFFDVQKNGSRLTIVGSELGVEKLCVSFNPTTFRTFTEQTAGNFRLVKLEDDLRIQYRAEDEVFDLLVKKSGDVAFLQPEDEYTGWNERKAYGIRTSGTLENRGNHAFYSLTTAANAFLNFGTIQAYDYYFRNNYRFNSGVMLLGVVPTEIDDLSFGNVTDDSAQPSFEEGVIENYGTLISNGGHLVKGGLHYHEHGVSDFANLDLSGGDVVIRRGRMNASGSVTGAIRHVHLAEDSAFGVDRLVIDRVQNFSVGANSSFHSPNSYSLNVRGNFSNLGELTSGGDLGLHLKNVPTVMQPGVVLAKSNLHYSYERHDRPRNSTRAPDITKDRKAKAYLMKHAPDPNSPEFKRLQDEFYRRMGYDPDADRPTHDLNLTPCALLAKRIQKTIYTDHYLNTITYHYTVTTDQYGREVSRVLTDVTETGYVFQRRTQETRDITVPIPVELEHAIDEQSRGIPAFRDARRKRIELARELSRQLAAQRKAEMNARFWAAMRAALTGAGADDPDVEALLQDPYFNALMNWDDVQEEEKEKLQNENPETVDLTEAIDDARYEVRDLTRWMDSDVRRFLDDVATTVSALAMLYPPTRAGAMVYGGVRGAIALAPRAVPHLGRAAVVIGAGAVAGYDRIRAFFSENFSGDKTGSGVGESSGWLKNTPQDVRGYFKGLRELIVHGKKVLGKGRVTKDGHFAYEIAQDFTYKGQKFEKGQFISRDRRHGEIEWFKNKDYHLGSIEPKGGTKYKAGKGTGRKLRF